MSATPRTDNALQGVWYRGDHGSAIPALCRELEMELATETARAEKLVDAMRQMWPFIADDYYPNCATPEFKAAVEKYTEAMEVIKP